MSIAQEWQKRLFLERDELTQRAEKLNDFIRSDRFRDLAAEDQALLYKQAVVMHDYGIVLTQRIFRLPRGVNYS